MAIEKEAEHVGHPLAWEPDAHGHATSSEADGLTPEHRDFLLACHGTLDLDPLPAMSDADPYNWPVWKKTINLMLVAFHAMMATFTAASIQSAFLPIALDLNVSIQRTSYLVSLFIAILGGAPLFWRPLANRFGRRPVFLLSLAISLVGNIGCAKSPTYATMRLCRAITAFFISPAAAIGSAVVAETFFRRDRARYMGAWTVMVTLGVPIAPLVTGFIAERVGYRWIYWTLAIVNAIQLVLYAVLGSETLYVRSTDAKAPKSFGAKFVSFRRIDPTPLTLLDFVYPLTFITRACVAVPAAIYAMIFLLGSILVSIEIPQIFPFKFGFNTEQVGLQNISLIVGTLLGEQVGGFMSDRWMLWRTTNKGGQRPAPEFRLWLSYIGYALTVCGVVVFLVQTGHASSHWNITPLIGAAIGAAGNQIVTTVMITYAVDCYREEAASVGVLITFVRQTWGFIGPFWFPQMITQVGFNGAAGIVTALIVVVSVLPTLLLQWKGQKLR